MSSKSTKNQIYETLVSLAKKRTLEKVTVVDVISEIDIARQTFYYYYHSIPEVYFKRLLECIPQDEPSGHDILFAIRKVTRLCEAMQREKDMTIQFFRAYSEEISQLMHDYFLGLITRTFQVTYGKDIPTKSMMILAEFHANGYTGIIRKWVNEGMTDDVPVTVILMDAWSSFMMSEAVENVKAMLAKDQSL